MYKPISFCKHVSSRAHVVYSIAYVLVEMGELEFGLTKLGKQLYTVDLNTGCTEKTLLDK